ncbi:hypothetical protein GQ44DRAFT_182540 [Phaeosphaeriaceae sp. PMI808]|nr:hypothetical protein GQ44DRAFT_182540 [Phaeosphaeriaceae sp. PMI808]
MKYPIMLVGQLVVHFFVTNCGSTCSTRSVKFVQHFARTLSLCFRYNFVFLAASSVLQNRCCDIGLKSVRFGVINKTAALVWLTT